MDEKDELRWLWRLWARWLIAWYVGAGLLYLVIRFGPERV